MGNLATRHGKGKRDASGNGTRDRGADALAARRLAAFFAYIGEGGDVTSALRAPLELDAHASRLDEAAALDETRRPDWGNRWKNGLYAQQAAALAAILPAPANSQEAVAATRLESEGAPVDAATAFERCRRTRLTAAEVELRALEAYAICGKVPADLPGPVALLRHPRMAGPSGISFDPSGVAPGSALLEFAMLPGGDEPVVLFVHLLEGQRVELLSLAAARACASIVAWKRGEQWDELQVYAVALAILMPRPCVEGDDQPVSEIADSFRVDEALVRTRLRMLRGTGAERGQADALVIDLADKRQQRAQEVQ